MEKTTRPRIGFYCIKDPLDKKTWSGTTYYLGQCLQKHIGDVDFLGPVTMPWILKKAMQGIHKFTGIVFKTVWAPNFSLLKNFYAMQCLKKKMKGQRYDFLFAPAAASELGYLNTAIPIVYFGDATFKIYTETYEEFKCLNTLSRWEGDHLERRALKKSNVVILSSKWAAQSAVTDYGVPAAKVEVLFMGANMDYIPDRSIIFKKNQNPVLTLLFLGVDWVRKGGEIAFDTLVALHKRKIPAKLIVCGVIPPPEFNHPFMEVIPFLDKNVATDYGRWLDLLSSVHFLLLPTRADCTPMVNAEANAFGVPAISTNVGGVADVVKNGLNGYCLPLEAKGDDYATLIADLFLDAGRYHQLIISSRAHFEKVLNWDHFANKLKGILNRHKLFNS